MSLLPSIHEVMLAVGAAASLSSDASPEVLPSVMRRQAFPSVGLAIGTPTRRTKDCSLNRFGRTSLNEASHRSAASAGDGAWLEGPRTGRVRRGPSRMITPKTPGIRGAARWKPARWRAPALGRTPQNPGSPGPRIGLLGPRVIPLRLVRRRLGLRVAHAFSKKSGDRMADTGASSRLST